jgi:hypothetical protein
MNSSQSIAKELKMKIRDKLALVAEGLYYQTRQYQKDLDTVLKPISHKGTIS